MVFEVGHGHRAGLAWNDTQSDANVIFGLDLGPDLVHHRGMARTYHRLLQVLDVHHIRAALFRFQRFLNVLDANHEQHSREEAVVAG